MHRTLCLCSTLCFVQGPVHFSNPSIDMGGDGHTQSQQAPLTEAQTLDLGTRGVVAVLKLCNQSVLYPAVKLLKRTALVPYSTRDKRHGWHISIDVMVNEVVVTHTKREVSGSACCLLRVLIVFHVEQARFSFDWTLRLTLDRPSFRTLKEATMVLFVFVIAHDRAGHQPLLFL